MAVFSHEIIIAGQAIQLPEEINVVHFRDNPEFSFYNPVGGSCAPEAAAPTPNAIPGLNVAPTPTSGSRRWSHRRGMSQRNMASMNPDQILNELKTKIRHVVIHHDATYTSERCFSVLCSRGLSTHFMVNFDGNLIQGLDPLYTAYHAGGFNGTSIGIDMNNIAVAEDSYRRRMNDEVFGGTVDYTVRETWTGEVNGSHKESFIYTDEQYETLRVLLRVFNEYLGIPLIYPQAESGGGVLTTRLSDAENFLGFMGHWHCQAGKWDPGPGFDWDRVIEELHGAVNHWPVDVGVAPIADVLEEAQVETTTQTYYDNNEQGPAGGTYPIGLNQQWHDGIHIFAEPDTPVRCIADGHVVLVRNGPNYPLGSPNFVLIKHHLERETIEYSETGEPEVKNVPVDFYSLYMHLERMDPDDVPFGTVPEDVGVEPTEDPENPVDENGEPVDPDAPIQVLEERRIPEWYQVLVNLGRESKNAPFDLEDDFTIERVRAMGEERFRERVLGWLVPQGRTAAHECIEKGNPYRFVRDPTSEENLGIPIQAGSILGYVGEFGEFAGERIIKNSMVQVQVFSTAPIFDDTRFEDSVWTRSQSDLSGNDLVSSRQILRAIMGDRMTEEDMLLEVGRGRLLAPSEIAQFFRGGNPSARRKFRRTIAYHFSEWDIAADDTRTAQVPILWPWQTQREYRAWQAHTVGFKWLNDYTRDLVNMPEGPAEIYTYHPIYLLGWWALNFGKSMQGQAFAGLEGDELRDAIEQERLRCEGEDLTEEERVACLDAHDWEEDGQSDVSLEEVRHFSIEYRRFNSDEPGEWPLDLDFNDEL